MKKHMLFFILAFFFMSAHAQLLLKVGIAGSLPTGDMTKYYYGGPGVDISARYLIAGKLGIGFTTGFQHFFAKDWENGYSDVSYNLTPIRGSVGFYFGNGSFKPYLGGELGLNATKLTYTYKYYDVYGGYSTYLHYDYSHTRFGAAPFAGFLVSLGKLIALDFNAKYNLVSKVSNVAPEQNTTYLSLNIGVVFKFGK